MTELDTTFEKRDSVILKRNAKSEYYWDIKIYFDEETQGYDEILFQIAGIDQKLKEKFL